ncbi:MAG: hypothetical protein ACJ71I_01230 [Nitrososphaeraceae archaeon]|jgi:hypothetical protein
MKLSSYLLTLLFASIAGKHLKGNMKLKYKVNHTRVRYNNKTGLYETGSQTFVRYEQAKENRWTCEKCFTRFATLKKLKQHKIDYHAY